MRGLTHREPSRCVYTVLLGGYEALNEQPAAGASTLPFICFTDDPGQASTSWELRAFTPPLPQDPIRSQRSAKLRPHALLQEFDQSLYIDNCVLLRLPPERLFEAADLSQGLSLARHSFRATLLDEFAAVAQQRLDDPRRIAEQLSQSLAVAPELLKRPPLWTGLLLRDHRNARMRAAMEIWLAQVFRYSRRDQLSCQMALHEAKLRPDVLAFDLFQSPFHVWPITTGRRVQRRHWPEDPEGFAALELRLRQAQQETAAAWRALQPVRAISRLLGRTGPKTAPDHPGGSPHRAP